MKKSTYRPEDKITKTRVPFLGLAKWGDWRFFYLEDGRDPAAVGLYYKTKLEALADLERYARENWGWTS